MFEGLYLHCDTDEERDRESGHQIRGRVFRNELPKVEDGNSPGELGAGELEIFRESKDSGIVDALLVEIYVEVNMVHDVGEFVTAYIGRSRPGPLRARSLDRASLTQPSPQRDQSRTPPRARYRPSG